MDSRYEHFKDFSAGPLGFAEKRKIWIEISDLSEDEFMEAQKKLFRATARLENLENN